MPCSIQDSRLLRLKSASIAIVLALSLLATGSVSTLAQEEAISKDRPNDVIATVNGIPITSDEVQRDLLRTLAGISLGPTETEAARSATVEKLINQRVAYDFLKKHKIAAEEDEVSLRLEELKTELATVEKTVDDYLEQTTQTLEELRFQMAWQISWQRYLDRKLTDEFLESHFLQNQRSMGGTELRVAHLLLKLPPDATPAQMQSRVNEAQSIAQQIKDGSFSWEAAVAQHSDATSKSMGGEVGWIKVNGPMPQTFTREAFKLAEGEISPPATTQFGIHLIKCMEVKQGKLGWRDVIEQVKNSAARVYFDAIVSKHRPEVEILK